MARRRWRGLGVAGLRLAVEVPPELPWQWPDGPLRRFAVAAEPADVRVRVRIAEPRLPPGGLRHYDSGGGIFDVVRHGRQWLFVLRIRGRLQRLARFDAGFRRGEVTLAPDSFYVRECHYPLAYPLDEVVFLHRVARAGGLLVHACGVTRQGRARLFTGPSGAGKTTLARLMQRHAEAAVLSDDRVVIRPDASGFRVFGTPWHGDAPLSLAASAPLEAIYAIHHAPDNVARPLRGAAAAAAVLGNAFAPVHDPPAARRTLALAAALAERVPIVRLGFARDARVARFVWLPDAGSAACAA